KGALRKMSRGAGLPSLPKKKPGWGLKYACPQRFRMIPAISRSPTVLTLKVLYLYPGLSLEEQGSRGRKELLSTSFRDYERKIREQLTEMFSSSGFDPRRSSSRPWKR